MIELIEYETEAGNNRIEEFIQEIERKHDPCVLAKVNLYIRQLGKLGLRILQEHPKWIKHLEDGIYELRPDRYRVLLFSLCEEQIVLLHGFEKKRNDTPRREIIKAKEERNDFLRRLRK